MYIFNGLIHQNISIKASSNINNQQLLNEIQTIFTHTKNCNNNNNICDNTDCQHRIIQCLILFQVEQQNKSQHIIDTVIEALSDISKTLENNQIFPNFIKQFKIIITQNNLKNQGFFLTILLKLFFDNYNNPNNIKQNIQIKVNNMIKNIINTNIIQNNEINKNFYNTLSTILPSNEKIDLEQTVKKVYPNYSSPSVSDKKFIQEEYRPKLSNISEKIKIQNIQILLDHFLFYILLSLFQNQNQNTITKELLKKFSIDDVKNFMTPIAIFNKIDQNNFETSLEQCNEFYLLLSMFLFFTEWFEQATRNVTISTQIKTNYIENSEENIKNVENINKILDILNLNQKQNNVNESIKCDLVSVIQYKKQQQNGNHIMVITVIFLTFTTMILHVWNYPQKKLIHLI